jgi:hypothetical protein
LGGENIGQLGSMRRYIGYSRKIAGSGFVGQPPEYFHICVYYGLGLWDIKSRAPEYFPVYIEFGKCGCTGFVEPAPRIFSGVFRIWKMWVCRVCGAGPRNIFRCIYNFENVGARVYGTGPQCIFRHICDFENADAWVCGENFLALQDIFWVFRMLKIGIY